jgi:uncharacterized SAM-binding protein YcdF (DUF218 family)
LTLTYWLKKSLLPPTGFVGLAWVGLVGHWLAPASSWPEVVLTAALLGLYASGLPMVGFGLLRQLERHEPYDISAEEAGRSGAARPPGAIVVLDGGGYVRRSAPPEARPESLERLAHGVWQHRRSGLPMLLTGVSSARAMAASLRDSFGVEARWVEPHSRTTHENAVRCAEMLHPEGVDSIVLVTHVWHMQRASAAFRRAGFEVTEAPTGFAGPPGWGVSLRSVIPTPAGWWACHMACHEAVGLVWYRLRYGSAPA